MYPFDENLTATAFPPLLFTRFHFFLKDISSAISATFCKSDQSTLSVVDLSVVVVPPLRSLMSSIEGFNCLPLLACNNAVIQTYQLYIVTVALCSSAPSPRPLKPCIEGFKRRKGKHKRGCLGVPGACRPCNFTSTRNI